MFIAFIVVGIVTMLVLVIVLIFVVVTVIADDNVVAVVFVLACFIGFQVIWNVSHSLHTPLMAITNAISGIIILGALLQINTGSFLIELLAGVSILIATINIVGGFLVTRRMLSMFQKS